MIKLQGRRSQSFILSAVLTIAAVVFAGFLGARSAIAQCGIPGVGNFQYGCTQTNGACSPVPGANLQGWACTYYVCSGIGTCGPNGGDDCAEGFSTCFYDACILGCPY